MSQVSIKPWYVAVLAVTTVIIVGDCALSVHAVRPQFCEKFVEPYGYICAEYRTHSADGYELVMHRIGSRPTILLPGSPESDRRGADTPSFNCEKSEQPFTSSGCLLFEGGENNIPKSGEESNQSDSSSDTSVDQNDHNQVDHTPSTSNALNPYDGDEGQAQEQELLYNRDPLSTDEDISAYQETQHSELPDQTRLEAFPHKHQRLPIQSLPNNSLPHTSSEVKDQKGSSVSTKKVDSSESNKYHNRSDASVTGSVDYVRNGSDLATVTEGRSPKRNLEAYGPVSSATGLSMSDGPLTAIKSETPDRSASARSSTLGLSVLPSEALTMLVSSPSASHDQDSQGFKQGRAPVLIMHQEFMNGDSWFQFTDATDRLLPLLLINARFDVWIGHERATYWSHGHLHLKHKEQGYWNWTWDEHAKYDVPAFLEYINDHTGFAAHYVGISQSATVGAATATTLESSRFMRSLTLIGPTMYIGDTSPLLQDAWAFLLGDTVNQTNWNDGYGNGAFNFSRSFPVSSILGRSPLTVAGGTVSGPKCCSSSTVVSNSFTNGWDGTTSFKNLVHYQQGMRTSSWRHFDNRNPYNNTQAYGVPYAPNYYPEDIPLYVPVLVVYGGRDTSAPPSGIRYLLSRFRTRAASVFLPTYGHEDLAYSVNRTQDVFIPILQFLEEHRWN